MLRSIEARSRSWKDEVFEIVGWFIAQAKANNGRERESERPSDRWDVMGCGGLWYVRFLDLGGVEG
jgi:hypothetical protein